MDPSKLPVLGDDEDSDEETDGTIVRMPERTPEAWTGEGDAGN
jgi:hypothetical protein